MEMLTACLDTFLASPLELIDPFQHNLPGLSILPGRMDSTHQWSGFGFPQALNFEEKDDIQAICRMQKRRTDWGSGEFSLSEHTIAHATLSATWKANVSRR